MTTLQFWFLMTYPVVTLLAGFVFGYWMRGRRG